MKEQKRCVVCCCLFYLKAHLPNQQYCSDKKCQAVRKGLWKKARLKTDPDYRTNQQSAQKKWQSENPDYWKRYREMHPEYIQRNRQECGERYRLKIKQRIPVDVLKETIDFVKSDVSRPINDIKTTNYEFYLVTQADFVKSDASPSKIINLSVRWIGNHGEVRIL